MPSPQTDGTHPANLVPQADFSQKFEGSHLNRTPTFIGSDLRIIFQDSV